MTARRTVIGLCMLCALAFSALAAQSASAATKGTTAFECKETGTGFSDAHCKTPSGAGKFSHVAIAEGVATAITGSNTLTGAETEVSKLKATIAGVATELQATGLTGTGSMKNTKAASGEHVASGTGVITYKGVSVIKPEGASCKVKSSEVVTNNLAATTEGQGDFLKFAPAAGSVFATFTIEGCKGEAFEALNKEYKVEGSLKGIPSGATTKFNHTEVTTQNTLKLNGTIKAGLEGTLTLKTSGGAPISSTTVETP